MEIITSRQNALCKLTRSLHQRKYRRKHGQFLIEGRNAVLSALDAHWELTDILIASNIDQSLQKSVAARLQNYPHSARQHLIQSDILQSVCEMQTSPQIAAIAIHKSTFYAELWQSAKVLLVLDSIADPGNVGTLIRAATAAGISGVILTGNCADPFSAKVIRASAGSIFHCPITTFEVQSLIAQGAQYKFPFVAAIAHGGENSQQFDWPQKYFLVLGNERHGISEELLQACRYEITIPIKGRAESLNVAMAGTILLFH